MLSFGDGSVSGIQFCCNLWHSFCRIAVLNCILLLILAALYYYFWVRLTKNEPILIFNTQNAEEI